MSSSATDDNFAELQPVDDRGSVADLQSARRSLERRFEQFAGQVRSRLLLDQGAKWVALVAAMAFATFVLDRTLRLSAPTRRALLAALLAVAAVQAWRRLVRPLRLKLGPDVLAAALERSAGRPIAARAATVLQLPSADPGAVSGPMVAAAVRRSCDSLAGIDFAERLDPRRRRTAAQVLAATALVSLGLVAASPSSARLWAARLFAGSNEPWPRRTVLEVAGLGDGALMRVPRGEAFVLRTSAKAGSVRPDTVSVRWRQAGSAVTALLTRFGPNDFRYDFPALQSDAVVELSGGDDAVGPFTVHPVERPRITDLRLLSRHPTEREPRTHGFSGGDAGDLSFLPYTKLELSFAANTPIAEAHLVSSAAAPVAAAVRRLDDRRFAVAWEHSAATRLQIELTGVEAALRSAPTNVSIGLRTDKPPRTTLGFTGVRQRITAQATIPLVAEARDDYGVERIDLQLKTEIAESGEAADLKTAMKTSATTRPIFGPTTRPDEPRETDVRQACPVHVPQMQLQPGHLLTLSALATDTCYPRPQSSSSRQITFRVVRPEELFKEILVRQQSERAKFHKQAMEAKGVRHDLDSAQTADAVAQLARRHRAMQREVGRIQSALGDSLTEMRLNVLGNSDAYELMERGVLGPMKALDAELMAPQRDALDALQPGDAATLMAAQGRQDQIIARMEEILQQMTQWDSFIDVLNQLNEIIRLENQVQKGTIQLKKKQTEGIFDP